MKDRRILVTGGNGRLGRAVLTALGAHGVAGTRRLDLAKDAILIDANGVIDAQALTGITAIINCANRLTGSPRDIEQANVTYPVTLAQSARAAGVSRFVQVSSFSIFGRATQIDVVTPIAPVSAYGQSKLAAEHALRALEGAGFRTVPLRLPFMFSAEEPAHLGRLVTMMSQTRMLPTLAGKPSRRSMITYAGAADALIALAAVAEPPKGALAAADPEPLELLTVARLIWERLGHRIMVIPAPQALVSLVALTAPTFVDRLFGSSVLHPTANLLMNAGEHGVEPALIRYLDHLKADRLAA